MVDYQLETFATEGFFPLDKGGWVVDMRNSPSIVEIEREHDNPAWREERKWAKGLGEHLKEEYGIDDPCFAEADAQRQRARAGTVPAGI